jgi:hypothetical protein
LEGLVAAEPRAFFWPDTVANQKPATGSGPICCTSSDLAPSRSQMKIGFFCW